MAWTSPRTWVSGETVTVALLNTHVRDNLKAIGDPWTSYTPTLTGITLGTGGTNVGAYMQAGKFVNGRVIITLGTSGTLTSAMAATLPVTPLITTDGMPLGQAMMFDSSASNLVDGQCRWSNSLSAAAIQYHLGTATGANATATTPWTWAAGDRILLTFSYEAA
jgi:hypothetical protein